MTTAVVGTVRPARSSGRPWRLVTVSHGTRFAPGNEVARELTARAGERLGVEATAAHVELAAPLLTDVMAGLATAAAPTVVVPLLLSTGHHVRHDVPAAVGRSAAPATLCPPLGPDRSLALTQAARLREAGVALGRPVVLLAAGSCDPAAGHDLERAAGHLAAVWPGQVRIATLSGRGPRLSEVVPPGSGWAVSPYLLAPGHFARRAAEEASALGLPCADVVGVHEHVVDRVVGLALARRGGRSAA